MLRASSFRGVDSGPERTRAARVRRPKPLKSVALRRRSVVPRLEALEDRTVPSAGYVFQTIDPPQAAQVSAATLINSSGDIVGFYLDANFVQHGYLLSGGQYTTIDDPNAGTAAGQGTFAGGINATGAIVGAYTDANFVQHGFLLSRGKFTTIEEPNAGTGAGQGTVAGVINNSGDIVGAYTDANSVQHGFLLSEGKFTTIDDPNAGTGPGQGTNAQGISASGVIVGFYFDANSVGHGFRLSGGQYTTLDDPAGIQTGVTGLNDHGQVSGVYVDANGPHGFLLSSGQYTTVDDPAGVLGSAVDSVNNSGKLVGVYTDANGVFHGYLATKAHGDSALDAFGSVAFATPDRQLPTQGLLNSSSDTPAAQGEHHRPPSPDVSHIDQVFAHYPGGTSTPSIPPPRFGSDGMPGDGLNNEWANPFAGSE
jgi:hypothetical protein